MELRLSNEDRDALLPLRVFALSLRPPDRCLFVPSRFLNRKRLVERGGRFDDTFDLPSAIIEQAEKFLGALYHARANPAQAPEIFSCSTLTKHVFARFGLWLPRFAVDQSYGINLPLDNPPKASLVFSSNEWPIIDRDERKIGHVGISCGDGTVIHGDFSAKVVTRAKIENPKLVRQAVPDNPVLVYPPEKNLKDIETALDLVRWLQRGERPV